VTLVDREYDRGIELAAVRRLKIRPNMPVLILGPYQP
jgi:hypothetical protein